MRAVFTVFTLLSLQSCLLEVASDAEIADSEQVYEGDASVVTLFRKENAYCLGNLIHPQVVRTASSCIDGDIEQIGAGYGDDFYKAVDKAEHPEGDYGLILLQEPVPTGDLMEIEIDIWLEQKMNGWGVMGELGRYYRSIKYLVQDAGCDCGYTGGKAKGLLPFLLLPLAYRLRRKNGN